MNLTVEQKQEKLETIKDISNNLDWWVDKWKPFKYNLDYTEGSINLIDDLLMGFHQDYLDGYFDFERFEYQSYYYGYYLIKVIENNYGEDIGVLSFDSDNNMNYNVNGKIIIFPNIWVMKMLISGKSDSILFHYKRTVSKYIK